MMHLRPEDSIKMQNIIGGDVYFSFYLIERLLCN